MKKRQKKRNKNVMKSMKEKAYQYIEDPSAASPPGQIEDMAQDGKSGDDNLVSDAVQMKAAEELTVTSERAEEEFKEEQLIIQTEKVKDMQERHALIIRKTKETDITLDIVLDGRGKAEVQTGIGFFDHMLNSFAKHGYFDLKLLVKGDLFVDSHHTIEDTGIALGDAIKEAIGDKKGIKRYGSVILPMDEALVLCSLDLSGRPYLVYQAEFTTEKAGYMDVEMVKEFFYAISYSAGMNLHMKVLEGTNNHHIIEAMFKAFGKALDEALQYDQRNTGILSTKGIL